MVEAPLQFFSVDATTQVMGGGTTDMQTVAMIDFLPK